jgi:hypothetical protein
MNYFQNHFAVATVPETPEFVPTATFKLNELQHANLGDGIADFNSLLGAVSKTWDTVKSIFSSSSKTAIVQSYTNLSFDQFASTCLVQSYVGLPPEKIDAFKSFIIN